MAGRLFGTDGVRGRRERRMLDARSRARARPRRRRWPRASAASSDRRGAGRARHAPLRPDARGRALRRHRLGRRRRAARRRPADARRRVAGARSRARPRRRHLGQPQPVPRQRHQAVRRRRLQARRRRGGARRGAAGPRRDARRPAPASAERGAARRARERYVAWVASSASTRPSPACASLVDCAQRRGLGRRAAAARAPRRAARPDRHARRTASTSTSAAARRTSGTSPAQVRAGGYDLGLAFDGDADRLLCRRRGGQRRRRRPHPRDPGARPARARTRCPGDAVVVHVDGEPRPAPRAARRWASIDVVTDVGDRYVLEAMREHGRRARRRAVRARDRARPPDHRRRPDHGGACCWPRSARAGEPLAEAARARAAVPAAAGQRARRPHAACADATRGLGGGRAAEERARPRRRPRRAARLGHRAARAGDGRGGARSRAATRTAMRSSQRWRGARHRRICQAVRRQVLGPRREVRRHDRSTRMCGIIGYRRRPRPASRSCSAASSASSTAATTPPASALVEGDDARIVRAVGKLEQAASEVARHRTARRPRPASATPAGRRTAGRPRRTRTRSRGCDERFAVVLNGIIENYVELKQRADRRRRTSSRSETDAEVGRAPGRDAYDGDLVEAVRRTFARARGALRVLRGLAADHPDRIVGARLQCPLVVGVGDGETFLASYIAAFLSETRRVKLHRGRRDRRRRRPSGARCSTLDGEPSRARRGRPSPGTTRSPRRAATRRFMLKEIHEQPDAIARDDRRATCTTARSGSTSALTDDELADERRVLIVACGTALPRRAGRPLPDRGVGRHARATSTSRASGATAGRVVDARTLVSAISQSGETADTLAALRVARERGARTLAITQRRWASQITREADGVLYTRAGPRDRRRGDQDVHRAGRRC